MPTAKKAAVIEDLTEKLTRANAAALIDYRGLTVAEISELRRQLRQREVELEVTKNTLLREAADWKADVLVVGSHGKGWAQRVLLGSVTERLINQLPTSLLVAPVRVAAAALPERRQRQFVAVH